MLVNSFSQIDKIIKLTLECLGSKSESDVGKRKERGRRRPAGNSIIIWRV
jgi:hypothetical protein